MSALAAAVVVLALVAVATVLGLWWRSRNGRAARRVAERRVTSEELGTIEAFGDAATIVQFSTEFCAKCPGTRRLLGEVAGERRGVAVIDVDLTHRAALADAFSVLQTPTILLLDANGIIRSRIGGAPTRDVVARELQGVFAAA
ncbi:TlpA family protein disulfide reductase [Plantibacter sp. Mn2098]|uniref:TlpA family protein disulfide reductase n=1 Tax=Plantibacter sp. Mn2098 TaxID=3395266 RepID=UPI003BC8E6E3